MNITATPDCIPLSASKKRRLRAAKTRRNLFESAQREASIIVLSSQISFLSAQISGLINHIMQQPAMKTHHFDSCGGDSYFGTSFTGTYSNDNSYGGVTWVEPDPPASPHRHSKASNRSTADFSTDVVPSVRGARELSSAQVEYEVAESHVEPSTAFARVASSGLPDCDEDRYHPYLFLDATALAQISQTCRRCLEDVIEYNPFREVAESTAAEMTDLMANGSTNWFSNSLGSGTSSKANQEDGVDPTTLDAEDEHHRAAATHLAVLDDASENLSARRHEELRSLIESCFSDFAGQNKVRAEPFIPFAEKLKESLPSPAMLVAGSQQDFDSFKIQIHQHCLTQLQNIADKVYKDHAKSAEE